MRRRVAVLGGGPAGLAAAMRAVDRGADCVLYEAGAEVGGLARSIELDGIRGDVGPHALALPRGRSDEGTGGDEIHDLPVPRRWNLQRLDANG